jgi:hypothetical protein
MAKSSSIEVKIYAGVYTGLIKTGIGSATANKYASFAVAVYKYVKDDPKLQAALAVREMRNSANEASAAFTFAGRASGLGLDASAARFASKGATGVGGALGAFVDYCAGLAKLCGVVLNECALAVTKVMLDVLTVVAMTETVVGVWIAAMQTICTVKDAKGMYDACFSAG